MLVDFVVSVGVDGNFVGGLGVEAEGGEGEEGKDGSFHGLIMRIRLNIKGYSGLGKGKRGEWRIGDVAECRGNGEWRMEDWWD